MRKAALGFLVLLAAPTQGFTLLGSKLEGADNGGRFGQSVSLSGDGNRLAVGAHLASNRGKVSVYEFSSNSWNALGAALIGENNNDQFGINVALSRTGSRLAVGAMFGDGANGANTGTVRVYDYSGSSWVQPSTAAWKVARA